MYRAGTLRAVAAAVIVEGGRPGLGDEPAAVEAYRAMAWMRKAVAAGFRDNIRLSQNKDLRVLHQRADFKELPEELRSNKFKNQ